MAWFTPAQSFAEGWQPGPQLQAAPIHGVLSEILQQRNYERALMQKNIADTIKNVRGEMQANKYLDSLKEAGMVPQDYEAGGVGGATYGTGLAKLIEDKKEADALEAYRTGQLGVSRGHLGVAQAQEARLAKGGGGAGTEMVTITVNGVEHQVPLSQVLKHPSLLKGAGGAAGPRPQTQDQVMREQARLLEAKDLMDQEIVQQREKNTKDLRPNVPYKRSGEYNRTVNRLKQLQQLPGMPTTDVPGAISTPSAPAPDVSTTPPLLQRPTADQAGGHAQDYGKPVSDADVEAMTWARAHPGDPRSAAILDRLGLPH